MTQGPDQDRPTGEEAGTARTEPVESSAASGPPSTPVDPGSAPSDPRSAPATPPPTESSRLARWRRRASSAPLAVGGVAVLLATGVGFGAGVAVGQQSSDQVLTESPGGGMRPGEEGEWGPGRGAEMPGSPGGGAGLPGLDEGSTEDGSTDAEPSDDAGADGATADA